MASGYVPREGNRLGYWYADDPSMEDLENMVFHKGRMAPGKRYRFLVVGRPKRISPEWVAKHKGWVLGRYDYAASYSIRPKTLGYMLDETDTPIDAFNMYLEDEGFDNEWLEIYRIELADN